jgi:hypothetical protein
MTIVKIKFKGHIFGEYVTGIPARDLSPAEWEGLTEDQRQTAIKCGLYQVETKKDGK